ncbi:MAG: cobalamin-dependent protein [Erysipelotrichaceae bacterium]|nr:cobalamin-dependent protein [Erysipelotrichaceae bacterium]
MSLLMNFNDQRFTKIAQMVFEQQFINDPKLTDEMDERRKRLMYDDVIYNISFLMTSVYFNDKKIFATYAVWLYELLCSLMKDLDRYRIMELMIDHYQILSDMLAKQTNDMLNDDERSKVFEHLKAAIIVTEEAVTNIQLSTSFLEGKYADIRKAYLDALLKNQTKKAYEIISDAKNKNIPLVDIYEEILKKVMYEVGDLWHRNIITVDREHYATSVTQTVMSTFYDDIFNQKRKSKTLVSCAIGSELHEMGIRMLSDLFEYHGWDSYYLGAALPEEAILKAIEEHQPDLVALSVTMSPYLATCESTVKAIKLKFPQVKIAVGGQAFLSTDKLWEKLGVDYFSSSATELLLLLK